MSDHLRSQIRLLKGNPITVLLILGVLGGVAVQQKDIEDYTDMNYRTVERAIAKLHGANLVVRDGHRGGWTLTMGGRQMILSTGYPQAILPETVLSAVSTPETVLNTVSIPTTTAIKTLQENQEAVVAAPETVESTVSPNPACLEILKSAGVGEPSRSKLASLPHVTPDYLTAHVTAWRKQRQSPGLLIHRIRNGDPAPVTPKKPGDDHRRFITGALSEFVEH